MEIVLNLAFRMLLIGAGALLIKVAIGEFQRKEYFSFGISLMCVINFVIILADIIFRE
jgi:hypothetical protein